MGWSAAKPQRWVMRRTAVVNQIRGLLLERGLTLPKGRSHVDDALPGILADGPSKLSDSFRLLLAQLKLVGLGCVRRKQARKCS
jgi:hypothetical protein